ncbi:MAG TPA: hypothetical protein VFW00_13340 [Rhodocyclaceae bacterium]|nr:hypothetical protein [Rhodocyclaceae bacterium]
MSIDLLGVTGAAVQAALNAASMRQIVGANNIANAGVAGYVPLRVSFEDALRQALQEQSAGEHDVVMSQPEVFQDTAAALDGEPSVRLDEESSKLVTNSIQYQALLGGLRSEMDILETAANDGKK